MSKEQLTEVPNPSIDPKEDPFGYSLLYEDLSQKRLAPSDDRSYGHEFGQRAVEAWGQAIVGEHPAKELSAAVLLTGPKDGSMALFVGRPSIGKSGFNLVRHQVVDGITDKMVAHVPHREDLSPAELLGKTTPLLKRTIIDGTEIVEAMTTEVEGKITPQTNVLNIDEINRTSPLVLNSLLGLLQEGFIRFRHNGIDGSLATKDLELVTASYNNSDTLFTHNFDPAIIGRFAYGTEMGSRQPGQLSEAGEAILEGFRPGTVKPVVSLDNLHYLRDKVEMQPLSDDVRHVGRAAIITMLAIFEDWHLNLGDPREVAHAKRGAQALSMLDGSDRVSPDHISRISRYMLVAKAAATASLSYKGSLATAVDEGVDRINEAMAKAA